jgi:hypothetical protein
MSWKAGFFFIPFFKSPYLSSNETSNQRGIFIAQPKIEVNFPWGASRTDNISFIFSEKRAGRR